MKFQVGAETVQLNPEAVIVAGFTGRDIVKARMHIAELRDEGVSVPNEAPAFYPLPPSVIVRDELLRVLHGDTSGESEIALIFDGGETFVTLASDHTDRRAEAVDIHLSKQVCPKPFAEAAWRYEEVADHWDALRLRSWIEEEEGSCTLYQEGGAADVLPPAVILEKLRALHPVKEFALLTGTVPARGGIRGADRFWAELADPVLGRSIDLHYRVRALNI